MASEEIVHPAPDERLARVFYALWPEHPVRASLAAAAADMNQLLHGRQTHPESLHLTLAFAGDVDTGVLSCLLKPPALSLKEFELVLDRRGCWAHNRIGWVAPKETPRPLRDLASVLEIWLRGAGFQLENRPYCPHVTLVRRARCVPLPATATQTVWPVRQYVLARSRRVNLGSSYDILGCWPIG